MNLPRTIPVDDLKKCAPEYDAQKIRVYQALYDGGTAMEAVKPLLIEPHDFELLDGGQSSKAYQTRLRRAPYARHVAGFIDWLVAATLRNPPMVQVTGPCSAESAEFYESLNDDCDGHQTPLAVQMRDAILEGVLHRRAYVNVNFPAPIAQAADARSLAGRFRLLPASAVEDWKTDIDGRLEWVRVHTYEGVRDPKREWAQSDRVRHVWAFIGSDKTQLYEAYHSRSKGWESKEAKRIGENAYAGGIPVWDICYRPGQWIMECCYDAARALFNRDASIEFLGDKFAFQILVLTTDRVGVEGVICKELSGLNLRPGESASFIAPSNGVLEPLFKSAEKLKKDLLDSIHASAQNAASIPQAGRLSGEAVAAMRDPMQVLLYSFAWPILDAYSKGLRRIIEVRRDPEGCAEIVGMDQFDKTTDDMQEELSDGTPEQRADGTSDGDDYGRAAAEEFSGARRVQPNTQNRAPAPV